MEIVKVDINELISPEYNPRQITDDEMEKLKNSINEFGYIAPIIVNKHNNHIVGGNQRYEALKSLDYNEVDVIFIDEPDIQREKALNIALNKISGDFDTVKLKEILINLNENDFDLSLTGFEKIELTDLNIELNNHKEDKTEITEDDYEPEDDIEVTVILGDIYQLGNHRLMCGDSIDTDDLDKLMSNDKAEMCFTDPPYDLTNIEYVENIFNNTINNAEIFIMHNERKLAKIITKYDEYFRRLFTVDFKVARLINSNAPMTRCDYVGHFRRDSPSRFNNLNDYFSTLIECAKTSRKDKDNYYHKHSKKVELGATFINHFSKQEDIVLDLFGGSGSTLIACEQLNRNCYMMELDPKYCQVIINRWEEFTGEKAVKIN